MGVTQTLLTGLGLLLAHGVEVALILGVLFSRGRNPQSSIAWMLTIVFVPYLGAILFLLFGVNRVQRRRDERTTALGAVADDDRRLSPEQIAETSTWTERGRRAAAAIETLCRTRPTGRNRVEILHNTHRTLGLIEQAIGQARHHIHVEYYIWEADETGRRVRDLLIERARSGVQVRFLYDSIGSLSLKSKFLRPMWEAGIEVRTFLPGQTFRERWSLNNRTHRKIVVVDGTVGFTGGMNIGDEYLGLIKKIGRWRDTHLRLEGPVVLQLQQVFREDWYFATGSDLTQAAYFPTPPTFAAEAAAVPEEVTRPRTGEALCDSEHRGVAAQIVAGGPNMDPSPFHQVFFSAINEAERCVYLTTGYFIPTDSLAMALAAAAIRGVRVHLLVPGRTPHLLKSTIWAGRSYYDKLLAAGCEIAEYEAGTMHAKTLMVDDLWSLVGSANFDARSALLNFEVGCVLYGTGPAANLRRQFELDLRGASPVTQTEREHLRPRHRIAENFSRLFAPIL